jgi:outer membrane lipoprotein-sorting protein
MKSSIKSLTVFTLLISLVSLPLIGQDATANRILNNVSRTYQTYKSIKAGFTINIKNTQNNSTIKQVGTLYLKGKKFRINLTDQEIYCDGKTMWTYFKEENEVQITKYDPNAQEINPSEIFTIYQKGFNYKYIGESIISGKTVQKIEMTPTDKTKPYFKVKLNIEKASNKITNMSVFNKNGIRSNYAITSFKSNLPISDGFFKFDSKTKPAVIEIDLRK